MKYRESSKWDNFFTWLAFSLIGIGTGFVASLMVLMEDNVTKWKKLETDKIISNGDTSTIWSAWSFYTFTSMGFAVVSSCMTVYWGPGANGSGVAEIIAIMNGVNYPGVFTIPTFITKALGVVLAVVGGLTIGKEGPLAHIGACVGIYVAAIPIKNFDILRNDVNKRHLIAAGTSAGVSAAFGAPIGGTLFAYEMSKPNTFWKFALIWKVFFSCALAVFSLAMFSGLWETLSHLNNGDGWDGFGKVNSGALKFGTTNVTAPTLEVIPGNLIVGAMCGVMGALFVIVNNWMGFFRKYYITKTWMRPIETAIFSFVICTTFFWAPFVFAQCESISYTVGATDDKSDLVVAYTCPPS
jgi:chloride channel 7